MEQRWRCSLARSLRSGALTKVDTSGYIQRFHKSHSTAVPVRRCGYTRCDERTLCTSSMIASWKTYSVLSLNKTCNRHCGSEAHRYEGILVLTLHQTSVSIHLAVAALGAPFTQLSDNRNISESTFARLEFELPTAFKALRLCPRYSTFGCALPTARTASGRHTLGIPRGAPLQSGGDNDTRAHLSTP